MWPAATLADARVESLPGFTHAKLRFQMLFSLRAVEGKTTLSLWGQPLLEEFLSDCIMQELRKARFDFGRDKQQIILYFRCKVSSKMQFFTLRSDKIQREQTCCAKHKSDRFVA